ncbi:MULTISPECIES: hypothetical protein [Bacillus]|uniref:hypothetical protein n=1 Tax=Bacillus TaxID=1386 RepID=UPI000AB3345B|nr:hypothetical protein [Bacillus cereus]
MKKKNLCKQVDYDFLVKVLSQTGNYIELHSKLQTYIKENRNFKSNIGQKVN